MLENVRIVLVNTSHTGNIGSVARAMKTMGLSSLYLVDPVSPPDSHSSALAAGATDVLGKAVIVDTLHDAIADCGLVAATSARSRTLSWPMLSPREAGVKLVAESQQSPVAIIFGRENNGLSNDELQQSQFHIEIPANPEYSSLNLAMAVQLVSYEMRCAHLASAAFKEGEEEAPYPLVEDIERFYSHLENTLQSTNFIRPQHPGQVMAKLRRLFTRARPDKQELNILRGMLSSIDQLSDREEK